MFSKLLQIFGSFPGCEKLDSDHLHSILIALKKREFWRSILYHFHWPHSAWVLLSLPCQGWGSISKRDQTKCAWATWVSSLSEPRGSSPSPHNRNGLSQGSPPLAVSPTISQGSSFSSPCIAVNDTSKKWIPVIQPREQSSKEAEAELEHASTLISHAHPPELWGIHPHFINNHPDCGMLLQKPKLSNRG